jgi:hypothetical protein
MTEPEDAETTDPEDWRSSGASTAPGRTANDERLESDRPPHWG